MHGCYNSTKKFMNDGIKTERKKQKGDYYIKLSVNLIFFKNVKCKLLSIFDIFQSTKTTTNPSAIFHLNWLNLMLQFYSYSFASLLLIFSVSRARCTDKGNLSREKWAIYYLLCSLSFVFYFLFYIITLSKTKRPLNCGH